MQALLVYCLFKKYMNYVETGRIAKSISRYSFGIYLVHPVFINFVYKVLNITPTNFPLLGVGPAIVLLWILVFGAYWFASCVMMKNLVLK